MAVETSVPVTVTDEASARIAELGMQPEFERMIEKAKELVPHLRFIRVTLEYDPEGELDPQVVIWCHRGDTGWESDRSDWEYRDWKVRTFSPDVCIQFVMIILYEAANGR